MGLVAICLCIVASACNSRNDMNYSTRTKFPWTPNISAPLNYPVEIKYAFLGFGTDGERYPVMEPLGNIGIGVSMGKVSFEDYEREEGLDIPNSMEVLWLSYAESKFYKLHTTFSKNLQWEILQLFRQGYHNNYDDKHENYSTLLITMLPGGKVWLYMNGVGRTVLVCDTLQAAPIEMTLGEFDKDAPNVSNSVQEYSEGNLDKEQIADIKANGIPFELWERYRERFNYDFKFEFEDKNSKLDSLLLSYRFTNGEFFYASAGINTELLSRPKELYLEWNVGDTKYKGRFFLNEKEVLEGFSKMYSSTKRSQKGTLIVKTSKYNNKFDIYLEIEGNKYFFKKTKIHVFRITPENKNDDDHLYYWNYEGEDVEQYLGE